MELIYGAGKSLSDFEKILNSAVALEVHYTDRIQRNPPQSLLKDAVPAAVLLLFGFSRSGASHLLFTRRTELVETHKGQMAFPGGHCEADDADGAVGTALRETEEEVGIQPDIVRVIGKLPSLVTATGFSIQPVVGLMQQFYEDVALHPNPTEIAEVIWISLDTLLAPGVYRCENMELGARRYPIDVYQVGHYRIWGATGSMTKNILDRLASLG